MKFNEKMASYAQSTMHMDGQEYNIKAKSYSDSLETALVSGASQMAIGRTAGQYQAGEAEIEAYADDFAELMERLGDEFYEKDFEITNAYEKVGETKLTVDTLMMCRFIKREASDESGSADALTRTLGVQPLYIKWNGKNPLKKMPKGLR